MRCLRHPHGAVGGVRATCVWSRGDSARLQTERGALGYGWCLGSLWGDLVGSGMTRQADSLRVLEGTSSVSTAAPAAEMEASCGA